MKNILLIAALFLSSSLVKAQTVVQVVWPFAAGSSQANMVRSILDSANNQQNKYKFIFVNKPGAGGSLAANYVLETKDNVVLASTSSFYIRPMLYKNSHEVNDFRPINVFCESQPLAIFSKKVKSLTDISNNQITLGVIPGSITTLVTRALAKENNNIKIIEVPYKGTPEATSDMLGGHIAGSVDFIGTSILSRFTADVNVLGITGKRTINNFNTFTSLGVKGLENISSDYFILVSSSVNAERASEFSKIFQLATSEKTKNICEEDFGQVSRLNIEHSEQVHRTNIEKWTKLTQGIAKE